MHVSYLHSTPTGHPSGVMMPGMKGLGPADFRANLRKTPLSDPPREPKKVLP